MLAKATLYADTCINKYKGLIAVWEYLMAPIIHSSGQEVPNSYITCTLPEGLELCLAFDDNHTPGLIDHHTCERFMQCLLHHVYGLCVYLIQTDGQRLILLRSGDVLYDSFLQNVRICDNESTNTDALTNYSVKLLLDSMDSEWDKNVVRVIIASSRSRNEIHKLGIDEDKLKRHQI